ncbi:MAG: biotin synthase [Burkholderiales bacterium]|nr:biotin synthase [Burkholderiales bacterium]
MPDERPPTIDPAAARRWARLPSAPSPWLHEEVARRMEERLQWIRLQPDPWLHWEPLRGGLDAHSAIQRRYPKSECFVVEAPVDHSKFASKKIAKPWWNLGRWTGAPTRFAMPGDGVVQMLWANMALHMADDPQAVIAQWHRLLAPRGFLMFSCLGPDSVRELHTLYARLGWPPPGHAFTDMHDWGDMLVQAGFAEPVMDMERITLTFETPARLLQELRGVGRNLHPQRFAGLRGRHWHAALQQALGRELADPAEAGHLPLTFEIIYGHAFKPEPRVRVSEQSAVSLQDMRAMLGQPVRKG